MHVTLWVPGAEGPRWPCVHSWMNVDWPCEHSFVQSKANHIKFSWNKVVRDFLATKSDYLWSCHNDVTFLSGTLKRLLSWERPLVSAMIFHRAGPALPHVWEGTRPGEPGYLDKIAETADWFVNKHRDYIAYGPSIVEPRPDDALRLVDFTCTGCVLIHRKVLEAIEDPWFMWDDDYEGRGEDRYFYEKARKAGYEAYVDRSCVAGHLGTDHPSGSLDFIWWAALQGPRELLEKEQ